MEKEIPTPVVEKSIAIDSRTERIKKWKELFLNLDSEIEVSVYGDDGFMNVVESLHRNPLGIQWDRSDDARIIIYLPLSEHGPEFLIGSIFNRMHSSIDIERDLLSCEENNLPSLVIPSKSWEEYYNLTHSLIENRNKNRIPKPPDI